MPRYDGVRTPWSQMDIDNIFSCRARRRTKEMPSLWHFSQRSSHGHWLIGSRDSLPTISTKLSRARLTLFMCKHSSYDSIKCSFLNASTIKHRTASSSKSVIQCSIWAVLHWRGGFFAKIATRRTSLGVARLSMTRRRSSRFVRVDVVLRRVC